METMKLLLGGSPCTHWSIAQTKNRETKPEGLGWELFKNYLIARDKYQPAYFLYENNKSMSSAIREQISRELGVEPILINSALVSAQSRQRLYWTNIPGVEQPEDRGILLRDILESGVCWREKAYTLRASAGGHQGMSNILRNITSGGKFGYLGAAEPVRIGTIESGTQTNHDSKPFRMYSPDGKAVTLQGEAGGYGAKTGLYATPIEYNPLHSCNVVVTDANIRCAYKDGSGTAQGYTVYFDDVKGPSVIAGQASKIKIIEPVAGRIVGRRINADGHRDDYNESIERFQRFEANENPQKTNCISTVAKDNMVAVPAEYYEPFAQLEITAEDGKTYPVYEVKDGQITIKGERYPVKLADGYYIIRKLTVRECMRLQTVPEDYIFPVSNTQAYKMLGNGWTVDVIAHILSYCPSITEASLEALSMYDGMSCGHLALDKLGAHIDQYYATEIDKYAIATTQCNYPDTIQLGDAFQVRARGWMAP